MPQLIIQPSTADNVLLSAFPTTNYGTSVNLNVGRVDASGGIYRSLLKFDCSALPNYITVTFALLRFYVYAVVGSSGRTLWAYRLTRTDWTETGSTWNNYKAGSTWTAAGGDWTVTNGVSVSGPAVGNWVTWDVATQINYAIANTNKIAHFLMKDGTETDGQATGLYSNNYTDDTTKCPKLTLTYRYKNGLWFGNG